MAWERGITPGYPNIIIQKFMHHHTVVQPRQPLVTLGMIVQEYRIAKR